MSATTASLSPLKSKVEAVVHAPAPTNTTELRSFLGLVSYYAKFIPHFADIVEPLRQLLGQGASFSWDDKAAQSFRAVKQLLATCKAVQMFNPSLLPVVTTDASDYSMGAVLQQRYGNDLRTVAFVSPMLLQAEHKYSVGEKEALACIWACEHWHVFLWGTKFELQTDHQALVTLLSSRGTGRRSTRIARWSAGLLYLRCYITVEVITRWRMRYHDSLCQTYKNKRKKLCCLFPPASQRHNFRKPFNQTCC